MKPTKSIVYSFDSFTMDVLERRLWRDSELVSLTPKAFDTLLVLLEHKGRIVEKDALLDQVWKDTFVEESTLAQNISTIRKALGTLPDGSQFIETVPRRGYRFLRPVSETASDEEIIVVERHHRTEISAEHRAYTEQPEAVTVTPTSTSRSRLLANVINRRLIALAAVICVTTAAIWFGIRTWGGDHRLSDTAFAATQVTKLTSEGNIGLVKVSPSGNLLAMVKKRGDLSSLELRQIDNSAAIEIVPPKQQQFVGVTFSPNDQQLYYVAYENTSEAIPGLIGKLYRVGSTGGQIEQIADDVDSPITLAPDGHRYAFLRNYLQDKQSAIVVSDLASGGETRLSSRPLTQRFSATGLSWSPDGKTIAAVANIDNATVNIIGIDALSGDQRELTAKTWRWAGFPNWLSDGSGLVFSAYSDSSGDRSDEVWAVNVPDGSARKIAGGTTGIFGLSMTADSKKTVAVESKVVSSFWVSPTGEPKDAVEVKRNLPELSVDSLGMTWTPDGKILFGSSLNGNIDIWSMQTDGGGYRQITTGDAADSTPAALGDGKTLVFISNRSGSRQLWRMNMDGTGLKQVTDGPPVGSASVPAAGNAIYYTGSDQASQKIFLYRISADGSQPVQLTSDVTLLPSVSPDGKFIACYYADRSANDGRGGLKLTLLSADNGSVVRQWDTQLQANLTPLVWSDNSHFNYADSSGSRARLFRQAIDEATASVILDLPNERLFRYAWSPDGRRLAYERGQYLNDVILIRTK